MSNPTTQLEDMIIYESYGKLNRETLQAIAERVIASGVPISYMQFLSTVHDLIGGERSIQAIRDAAQSFSLFGGNQE